MYRKLIATSAVWFPLPIRLALGAVFVAHGAQKVLGSFGGPGLAKFSSAQAPYAFMRPAWLWMGAAAFAELIGGILVILGLLTRMGAFLIFCTMLVAIVKVHWPGGFFAPGGIEYVMSLIAMSLALLISGGGMASADLAMSGRRR